jgi:excisionase family DNA binding protein
VFDRSISFAEHLEKFLLYANLGFYLRSRASILLFGIFLSNATPLDVRAALRGLGLNGASIMLQVSNDHQRIALRPREAARILGISTRTLFSWTKEGVVPSVKVGRAVLYSVAALEEWLRRTTDQAAHPTK